MSETVLVPMTTEQKSAAISLVMADGEVVDESERWLDVVLDFVAAAPGTVDDAVASVRDAIDSAKLALALAK